ncbi:unnamed protein product [Lathyrus sativus]|nr:unnamed protein product [Lathyrus sativus]
MVGSPLWKDYFFTWKVRILFTYKDFEQIGNVLLKPSVTESMFTAWFEANKKYHEAKLLTYSDFVTKFVYQKKNRTWKPRKKGYTIGRLIWVPQSTGELFYLRMMLTVKKGPKSYEDIKKVNGSQHNSFREACFAMGFLQDDREFIEALKEAHKWSSDEQKHIYFNVMDVVERQNGGVFFLYGYGGTGKTFMWNTLAVSIRYKHKIVLPVASSGIASLLLPGGRTTHSRFKIHVPTLHSSICNIDKKDDLAELLKITDLIIWDETLMANRFFFEALDKSLRDILIEIPQTANKLFGGKIVIFCGDFRQILPVVPRGSISDIIHSTINASYIWDQCKVLKLTKNMRLQSGTTSK